jgi:hypothetical protein
MSQTDMANPSKVMPERNTSDAMRTVCMSVPEAEDFLLEYAREKGQGRTDFST